jgi:RNA polymerase sigma-70 factor (ECF subfamily)
MSHDIDRGAAEAEFRIVFSHLGAITAYARRRGSTDADALAAEVMTIAWRRLRDVPKDDPLPWLYGTARNLVVAEARRSARVAARSSLSPQVADAPETAELDPELAAALRSLSGIDREALLLIAWEDLTPTQAASALGISSAAFRVRLFRARRRLRANIERPAENDHSNLTRLDVEGT